MKYLFIINLFCLYFLGNISLAQQKKPTLPKTPATTVKTFPPKPLPTKTTIPPKPATPTNNSPANLPPKEEEKKPIKTTTTPTPNPKTETPIEQPSSTTIQQSSGPIKGNKLEEEVKESKPPKEKMPKIPIEERGIRFGVRAEATQHYTLEVGVGTDFSPGINIGILINLPISEQISIQPEVLFSLINRQASTDDNNYVKSSIGSILVPLMFNFNFGKSTTKFMLDLGGYTNYGLNQSTKVISLGKTVKDGSVDLGSDRFDYGLGVGLGVKLNNKLLVEARSFYGMKDNFNKNGFGTIGVGYLF